MYKIKIWWIKKDRSTTGPVKNSKCSPQFFFQIVQKYTSKRRIKLQRKKSDRYRQDGPLISCMKRKIHSLKRIHAETIGAENTALSKYTNFLNTRRCLNKNILRRDGRSTWEKYHSSWAGNYFKIYAEGLQELTHFICGE